MSKGSHRRDARGARADLSKHRSEDPQAAGHRHGRLQQIVFEELAALVRDELTDPALEGLAVTRVDLSPDYRNARVYYSTGAPHPTSTVERALARVEGFLRARLLKALPVKHAPALRLVFDAAAADAPDEAHAHTAPDATEDPCSR